MTNKKSKAVKEVKVVLEVFEKYAVTKKDIPYEKLKETVDRLKKAEEELAFMEKEYYKTINELLLTNSLLTKFEQLCEMIGTIGTISVESEDKLDKTINILHEGIKSINN